MSVPEGFGEPEPVTPWYRERWVRVVGGIVVAAVVFFGPRLYNEFFVDAAADLKVGDCFDDQTVDGEFITEFATVPMVDCDDPHDNEVFAVIGLGGGTFPGEDTLVEEVFETCVPLFESYVGSPYATSRLNIFPIYPTEDVWVAGDRKGVCGLYDLNLEKLTGSMMNSGE
jgi:hypothetical protein